MQRVRTTNRVDVMAQHPCFSNTAHSHVGRIHLPVAARCNIQCNYCERNICAALTFQHPGWTAKLLSVREAVDLVRGAMRSKPCGRAFVVGVAGPGDPLANEETFQALRLIHREYPDLLECVSTNGLLLEDRLTDVVEAGVEALTVTVNAADSNVGANIYSWASYRGFIYRGEEAASLLIAKQFSGIRKAADTGLSVKVNTVLIPGVNDHQMAKLARRVKESGAELMNIMPLIPSGRMKNRGSPSCEELRRTRRECERIMPQFRRCEQCRADVMFTPWLTQR